MNTVGQLRIETAVQSKCKSQGEQWANERLPVQQCPKGKTPDTTL